MQIILINIIEEFTQANIEREQCILSLVSVKNDMIRGWFVSLSVSASYLVAALIHISGGVIEHS